MTTLKQFAKLTLFLKLVRYTSCRSVPQSEHLHLKRMLSESITVGYTFSLQVFFCLLSPLVLIRPRCEQYLYMTEL